MALIDIATTSVSAPRARVVLFSGGRGAGVLSKELVRDPRIQLTLAINGYDDGASTGEVRRFLGDSLGPSDFRKNGSRLAQELRSCPQALIDLLDTRLPDGLSQTDALADLGQRALEFPAILAAIEAFATELTASGASFNFDDCSVGNLVFAGVFLQCDRHFNQALDRYCALLGLPPGLIENVTTGTNAHLVALCSDGTVLATEEAIVGATRPGYIKDFYLIDRLLTEAECETLMRGGIDRAVEFFESRRAPLVLNPRLADRVAEADVIIYAPGTQYLSLFPSYVTPGLGGAIARNMRAVKLLITNIQTDVEIVGRSAVELVDRALYYLQEKGALRWPSPCLITHYLMNEPGHVDGSMPYVPLGQVDALEDPRLIRIANYEEGASGRHDAAKVLTPFIQSLLRAREVQKVAVLLYDADSPTKVAQSILEMVRGGMASLAIAPTIFHEGPALEPSFLASVPVPVRALHAQGSEAAETRFREVVGAEGFDYVVLFESSGMYRGEDVVGLTSYLASGRLDAVWGSRRLSPRDVEESYRVRFRHNPLLGAMSWAGSHALSLACLALFGRYMSDTLSGARAVRAADAADAKGSLTNRLLNYYLLASLLRRKADILEVPVQFVPLSPDKVKRTSVFNGLAALGVLARGRLHDVRPRGRAGQDVVGEESRGAAGSR